MDNDQSTPESREDWERERDSAEAAPAPTDDAKAATEAASDDDAKAEPSKLRIPDNDDVEPGHERQPESADGRQDDGEPVEPKADEADEGDGKLRRR